MQINISARHIDLTPALADYVRKKVEKCQKYFDHLVWAQVILSVEKYRQVAELVIHASKTTFRAKEESVDLYAAVDLTVDKMDKQLRKYKEIAKIHRKDNEAVASLKVANARGSRKKRAYPALTTGQYVISEVKRFDVKPVSIEEAISEMNGLGYNFFMFLNADTSRINVIYTKENGSYGLLEPDM